MGGSVDPETCFEHRISDWLGTFFESVGAVWERIEVAPGRDNIIARYDAGPSKRTILLDAHQDTVPVLGMSDPFDPRCQAGRIYGRGACDVKGGMAAMLFAFRRLIVEQPKDSANVVLSCSCDEEAGMLGVRELVSYWDQVPTKSKLLSSKPDACVVAEPTDLNIVVAHLGVLRFRVRTHGKACHASDPSQGSNAIYAMAPIIDWLDDHAQSLAVGSESHPLCGRPALSVGLIQGGTSVNIVPDQCVLEIDRRLIPGEDPVRVWQRYRDELAQFPGAECDSPFLAAPSLGVYDSSDLADCMATAIQQSGRQAKRMGVPYCTNASTIESFGVPSVVFGPGSIAQAHTADEYVEVAQLDAAAEVYFQLCAKHISLR